ncbi:MAG: two-component sensor histidine kinase, partial [Alphaproteobacteria bacterium]|nr:two-component sensor histidine kinase [Alphaproteobacteria bacterium]
DEVRQAGQAFIEMKERIERYLTERTTMLAGVSHDLRTPLTRMKLQLSMMEQDDVTATLNQDISEMEHMLTGYLAFAKGEGKEQMEHIELTPFITELVEKFKSTDFPVSLHIEEPLAILGRPHELVRVFSNLLSNAQKYAHSAVVSVGRREDEVQIIIDDDGPGIPPKKRADAFKPFFRLDKSRNSATGGVGLGLTIVRDAVLAHGGTIKLENSPQKGLRVIITLPEKK